MWKQHSRTENHRKVKIWLRQNYFAAAYIFEVNDSLKFHRFSLRKCDFGMLTFFLLVRNKAHIRCFLKIQLAVLVSCLFRFPLGTVATKGLIASDQTC